MTDIIDLINRSGIPTIVYKGKYKEEITQYISNNKIRSIVIDGDIKVDTSINDFLKKLSNIDSLCIIGYVKPDPNALYHLNLKELVLPENDWNLDFTRLPNLEYLRMTYCKKMNFKNIPSSLKEVTLSKLKSKDIKTVFGENSIEKLALNRTTLENLDGIEYFKKLKNIIISYSPKLTDIKNLSSLSKLLNKIEFDTCKSLSEFAVLKELSHLEEINIYNADSILTTEYFKNLSHLQILYLRGKMKVLKQNIEDVSHIKRVVIADMDLMIGCK